MTLYALLQVSSRKILSPNFHIMMSSTFNNSQFNIQFINLALIFSNVEDLKRAFDYLKKGKTEGSTFTDREYAIACIVLLLLSLLLQVRINPIYKNY